MTHLVPAHQDTIPLKDRLSSGHQQSYSPQNQKVRVIAAKDTTQIKGGPMDNKLCPGWNFRVSRISPALKSSQG
jgi:hypothetical protein